jgi:hypothetical protein
MDEVRKRLLAFLLRMKRITQEEYDNRIAD